MSYITPLRGGIYKLPEPNSESRRRRVMLKKPPDSPRYIGKQPGDGDPVFWAFQGVLILLAIALLSFLFWSVGSIVWTRPWNNEIPSYPGLLTSVIWTLTGVLEGAALGWTLWKFGFVVKYLAKQRGKGK